MIARIDRERTYDPTTSYIYLLDICAGNIEREHYLDSTEIYNTLFRELLTRYSQIFEEERSFSKFHTLELAKRISNCCHWNTKNSSISSRSSFEELSSRENFSPFLSNLPFIPASLPFLLVSSFERAGSTGCWQSSSPLVERKFSLPRRGEESSSLCGRWSFRDKGSKISERTSYRSANEAR